MNVLIRCNNWESYLAKNYVYLRQSLAKTWNRNRLYIYFAVLMYNKIKFVVNSVSLADKNFSELI